MAWGCMSKDGIGTIQIVQGNTDASQYKDILAENLPASLRKLGDNMGKIIFQQDDDPKQTSKIAKEHFASVGVQVLSGWPPQSPDLNPIENLWGQQKAKLGEVEPPPANIGELVDRSREMWETISPAYCRTLVESMPRCMQAVITAKGGYTKY